MTRIARLVLASVLALAGLGVAAAPAQAINTCTRTVYLLHEGRATVPADSGGHWSCVMGVGNSSTAVSALQRGLNKCYGRGLDVDGQFGPATKSALIYAQSREGIAQDGVYGPQSSLNLKWPYYNSSTGAFVRCRSTE